MLGMHFLFFLQPLQFFQIIFPLAQTQYAENAKN